MNQDQNSSVSISKISARLVLVQLASSTAARRI